MATTIQAVRFAQDMTEIKDDCFRCRHYEHATKIEKIAKGLLSLAQADTILDPTERDAAVSHATGELLSAAELIQV